MYLTLEVVSPQAASLGAQRRRIVGPKGLTIGRVPGNDWVIPDPYISRQHARISYLNGAFFVESLGRNAIAIGNANNAVTGSQPQPLRNGDHLFIDQYEIIVTTMQGDPPGAAIPNDDPFGVLPVSPGQAPMGGNSAKGSQSGGIPDIWDGGLGEDFTDTGVLDPMAALGGGSRPPAPEPLPPVNWQQTSPMGDHFEPPPVRAPSSGTPFDLLSSDPVSPPAAAVPSGASGIPDNWDRTNLTRIESAPAARLPSVAPPPAPPSRPAASPAPAPSRRPANREAVAPRSPTPAPAVSRQPGRAVPPTKRIEPSWVEQPLAEAPSRPAPPTHYEAPPRPTPPPRAPAASDHSGSFRTPATGGSGSGDLAELLRGAGLSEHDLSPEIVHDLGQVLRVVVQGVMDVLRARAEIKLQFRLPLTRIQSDENNPLKHCPNVESALHTLLIQRNPGYLSAVQAFEDAFADIRSHQMAMLEGVRVAFESMLESFDPEELQKQFEGGAKRGGRLGFGGGKSKFWDLYVAHFAQLGSDADDTYRRLFGDVFAEAYEKQLERLKTLARNTGKT